MRWLDGITDSMDKSLGKLWGLVMDRETCLLWFMGSQRIGHNRATELKLKYIYDFGEGGIHSIKHIFFQKVSAGLIKLLLVMRNSHHEGS